MEQQNPTPTDGFELLKKVIETNEENSKQSLEVRNSFEDILNMIGITELTLRKSNEALEKAEEFSIREDQKRKEFIDSIPKSIDANFSVPAAEQIDKLTAKSKLFKYFFGGIMIMLSLTLLITFFTGYYSKQWYSESIRSKMEIRQQILDEIKNNGQSVYKVEDYQQLQHNTELINKWMKKNPKDAEKFLRFKDGYESR
ncbi:hypothetical protein AAH994_04355 [Weeksellaceae bacterium A-14]